ncbi:MAG: SAM-dependent methyltransferase [Candidatus Woesearchaeota archaeon]
MKYIIEHLDPQVWEWSYVEYKHISDVVGKENTIFTNVRRKSDALKLEQLGEVYANSVISLVADKTFTSVCVLDPAAKIEFSYSDKTYSYLVVGGVLGNFPMDGRTNKCITSQIHGAAARHLGKFQMSTNTAVVVAHRILEGTPLSKMKFKRKLVIPITQGEEVELPFRFLVENNEVVLPEGYIEMVKEQHN